MSESEPVDREHGEGVPYDDICPHCGEQGFDGQGHFRVDDLRMYRKRCWNCGLTFAVEDPRDLDESE